MTDSKWSPAEKKVARRAFDLALSREYAFILKRIKDLAARGRQARGAVGDQQGPQ
jgi:hypothetical protein